MKIQNLLVIILLIFSLSLVVAENPPALTGFQRFYGSVSDLPSGTFTMKATVDGKDYSTLIASDGTYGISPTFKVYGRNGLQVTFFAVNSIGVSTEVGSVVYESNAVTNKELNFLVPLAGGGDSDIGDDSDDTTDDSLENSDNTGSDNTGGTGGTGGGSIPDASGGTSQLPPDTCIQSWTCPNYGSCLNGLQTRTCVREDDCDSGIYKNVITKLKPKEKQICTPGSSSTSPSNLPSTPTSICSDGEKRCLGGSVQSCQGGNQWITSEFCGLGCQNSACLNEGSSPADNQSPSNLMPYIFGMIILVIIIALVIVLLLHQKKLAPAKNYIKESRAKGFSDKQIKSKLVTEGWDGSKVDKFLK